MTEVKRPTRLDLKDLPRDKDRALGGLRSALVASTNYCKTYPRKLKLLGQTLVTVLDYVEYLLEFAEEQAVAKEKARVEALSEGTKALIAEAAEEKAMKELAKENTQIALAMAGLSGNTETAETLSSNTDTNTPVESLSGATVSSLAAGAE